MDPGQFATRLDVIRELDPIFVLCKLFDLIEVLNQHTRMIHLVLIFSYSTNPGKLQVGHRQDTKGCLCETQYLFDLIHSTRYLSSDLTVFRKVAAKGTTQRL